MLTTHARLKFCQCIISVIGVSVLSCVRGGIVRRLLMNIGSPHASLFDVHGRCGGLEKGNTLSQIKRRASSSNLKQFPIPNSCQW